MSSAGSSTPSNRWPATAKSVTPDPTKWTCEHCAKTSYANELRAWKAIGTILRINHANHADYLVPCRVYACPVGEGFHLTSSSGEQ